jgi:hypothetical protein
MSTSLSSCSDHKNRCIDLSEFLNTEPRFELIPKASRSVPRNFSGSSGLASIDNTYTYLLRRTRLGVSSDCKVPHKWSGVNQKKPPFGWLFSHGVANSPESRSMYTRGRSVEGVSSLARHMPVDLDHLHAGLNVQQIYQSHSTWIQHHGFSLHAIRE